MEEEVKNWIKQAKEDYKSAKFNLEGKQYKVAIFLCQQSVEKAFKALLLKKKGEIRKIHDLVILGKEVNASENMINKLKELTLAYVYSRYPDVKQENNLKEKAFVFLKTAEDVLKWTRLNL